MNIFIGLVNAILTGFLLSVFIVIIPFFVGASFRCGWLFTDILLKIEAGLFDIGITIVKKGYKRFNRTKRR